MAGKAWKQFEAAAARLFWGARFWANSGERSDFEGRTRDGVRVKGQCKLVKTLSLEALTKLAEEKDVDVVCVKVRRGRGCPSPGLVVMTFDKFQEYYGETPKEGSSQEGAAAALREQRPKVPRMR
jgi:hypothetical protein